MENASKALIIAGAILLSILIISLGIMIYNQAAGVVNNNAMSDAEKTSFNAKFEQYAGTVKGAQVRSLYQQVITSNSDDKNEERKVSIGTKGYEKSEITSIPSDIKAANTYTVEITYSNQGKNKGLVSTISIGNSSPGSSPSGDKTTNP